MQNQHFTTTAHLLKISAKFSSKKAQYIPLEKTILKCYNVHSQACVWRNFMALTIATIWPLYYTTVL